ncbi:ATP-binding cassette domain-containing protein [Arthrobacter sp. BL-252-APC-1A]|uniref:ABC transporter ATP-binding protein n=1 Tax=Arthrobacter sp. BL-252-APC-1A TaxID=2606622 RepID=UPI0012B228B4|nr:ATP-binding cassette domain-containing protein [Arthrobacter sp. BL-252-APC-1A]MSR99528.1 ATP-binding cassette domain-containing protein [Arthrobacter sp. BL-252-APC-1A]
MSRAPIEIQGLRKSFGSVDAVSEATFIAASGRVTGFLGPNGAGKTTTLRILLGLTRPSGGTALVHGRRYRDHPQPASVVGAVVDIAGAHPRMTARQHLLTYSALSGLSRTRIEAVLEQVGATAFTDRRIGTFSTGMRQRLSLATALLGDPEILVLDEPSNGLDPGGVVWLRTFLQEFARSGRTVLLSSHVLGEVEHTVDDVVLIDKGRVRRAASLTEIRSSGASLEDVFLRATQGGDR